MSGKYCWFKPSHWGSRGFGMGRRRRKVIRVRRKRLPKIYLCPQCGKEGIRVELLRDQERATVRCGSCGLTEELPIMPAFEEVDAYCRFADRFYMRVTNA